MSKSLIDRAGHTIADAFHQLSPRALMIALLLICYFGLVPNSNEEQYLALAKQYMDADWIPQSVNLSEFPGTRLIYQIVFGFVLQFLGFNSTVAIFRVILILLMVWPISKIYRELKFSNTEILVHLGVLFIAHQSLFAGSFIFLSVEPKCFSYVAVFWALYFMVLSKQAFMIVALIAATYLHALVGFWSALYILASQVLWARFSWQSLKAPILSGLAYAAAVLPFIFYLTGAIEEVPNESPSADWIYTYFRSPHHTALAPDISYFYQNHFYGILWTGVAFFFMGDVLRRKSDIFNTQLSRFALAALGGSLLLVILAFVDREGRFLKYYPYRIMSMATFCLFLALSKQVVQLARPIGKIRLTAYTLLLAAAMLLEVIIPNLKLNAALIANHDKDLIAAAEFIKAKSQNDDVVLSMFEDDRMIRLTERNAFSTYKFVPADKSKLHDWYQRNLAIEDIREKPELIFDYKNHYRIDYIISDQSLTEVLGKVPVYQRGEYMVYLINKPE